MWGGACGVCGGLVGCVGGLWGVWEACGAYGVCRRRVRCGEKLVGDLGQGMACHSALLSGYLGKSGHLPTSFHFYSFLS